MKQLCPKCKSLNTYSDGTEMACMMCGKRWPINGQPIAVIKETIGRKRIMGIMEKSPSGKTGICLNCERKKFIAGADGLCGTCHKAVKGMSPSATDYHVALDEVKRRLTAPVCVSSNKKIRTAKKTEKPVKINNEIMSPKEDALADLYPIVEQLKWLCNFHLASSEKIKKAIEALK
jgi:hypothetical protein